MAGLRTAMYFGLLLLLSVDIAPAQRWVADVSAGAAEYDAVAGDVGSLHAILGVRRQAPTWLSLSAGAPLDSAAIPWLAAGGGMRPTRELRGVDLGAELAAVAFGYEVSELDARGGGATLVALPFVGFGFGSARVEMRSGALHHTSIFDGESRSRTVHDSGIRARLTSIAAVTLEGEGRLVRDGDASYPFLGGAVQVTRGPGALWVRGGRWIADALEGFGWGIGASVALPGDLSLRASFERESDDPLYWNGPRTGWTIGLTRVLAGRGGSVSRIAGPGGFQRAAGSIVLRVPFAESGAAPAIAGDFTDWESVLMTRGVDGWEARFDLEPGVYHYSFIRPDGRWFLPASVENRVDDGFGGTNAVLVVTGS